MRISLLARAAAIAIAATTALAVTGTADAASTHPSGPMACQHRTRLLIHASPTTIQLRQHAVVSGVLQTRQGNIYLPLPHQNVGLYRYTNNTLTLQGTRLANQAGKVSFVVYPTPPPSTWPYYLKFLGSSTYCPSQSARVTITIKA